MAHSRLPGAVDARLIPAYLGWTPFNASLTLRALWQASLETTFDDGDSVSVAHDFSGNHYDLAVQGSGAAITWQAGGGKPYLLTPSSGTRWLWNNNFFGLGDSAWTLLACSSMQNIGSAPPVVHLGWEDCGKSFALHRNQAEIWCLSFDYTDLTTTYPITIVTYSGGSGGTITCHEDVDGMLTNRGSTTLTLDLNAEAHLFDYSRYAGTPYRNARFYAAALFSGVMSVSEMEDAMLYFERLRA